MSVVQKIVQQHKKRLVKIEIYVGKMVLRGKNFEYITDYNNTKKLIFGEKRCR
jgi:hypothetical protein